MAAQALYLKYRPQTFEEVVGQEPIMHTLRNALRQGKIRHAYLFSGPRGTGKTTTARLLAKAVNCQAPEGERPCNVCPICTAINEGRLLDLIEIDAASNRGIDEIRDIREKVGFRPNEGRFKVYVLDEAHMLTEPAFNALLKTLEEPPPHIIFTLVTTDPHKIPATIASRCQRFDFRRIPLQAIVNRLAHIADREEIDVEQAALELIARQGTGAMRDAISLLDQLASYGEEISLGQVQMVLGTVASEAAGALASCLAAGDVAGGLDQINRTVGDGIDPRQFGWGVVEYLRGLLLIQQGAGTRLLNATAEQAEKMELLAEQMPADRLLRAIRLFNEAVTDIKTGLQVIPQLPLEMALVESIVASAVPAPAEQPQDQGTPVPPARLTPTPADVRPEVRRIAERPAAAPEPASDVATQATPQPEKSGAQTQTGQLGLTQVLDVWDQMLQLVRQRNPATQAVLNSGCEPVEVHGNEIVVTFPFSFLREKLRDPQRMMEIQDALSEVLHRSCHVRLVLAADYVPHVQAQPDQPVEPTAPSEQAQAPAQPEQAHVAAQPRDDEVPAQISKWAEERGAEVKVVPP